MERYPYADETFDQASERLRLTLALLARHKLAPSPINYRVAYEYVIGGNDAVTGAFDQLVGSTAGVTSEGLAGIHGQFIGEAEAAYQQGREELRRLVLQIQEGLVHSGGNLADYAQTLSRFAQLLDTATSPQQMATEAERVLEETRDLGNSQLRLESQMAGVLAEVDALRQELEQVRQEVLTDALTGLANRKAFDNALNGCIRAARETNTPLALILADIDRFKEFNDSHGHLVGDKVLRFVGGTLRRVIKGKDFAARFGGEEFAVILPQTALIGAEAVAEQIRSAVSAGRLVDSSGGTGYGVVTISLGVAQYRHKETGQTLVQRTDQALYLAKKQGRNRIVADT